MSDDVLTPAEVESLLSGKAASGDASKPSAPDGRRTTSDDGKPRLKAQRCAQRPELIGTQQVAALRSMHESCGRNFAAALSKLLRSSVSVRLTAVDQLTYRQFIFGLENSTCCHVLRAAPLEGRLILDISPVIVYPIIDRLLGGGGEAAPVERRPLTEIELRLVSRVTSLFLQELRAAWKGVLVLDLAVERVESNPQLIQVVPPYEPMVLTRFELSFAGQRGLMHFAIPSRALARVAGKLAMVRWAATGRSASSSAAAPDGGLSTGTHAELIVQLTETKISAADLSELHVGDIIATEKHIHSPLAVTIDGATRFRARPGAVGGHKAIRVEEAVPPDPTRDAEAP